MTQTNKSETGLAVNTTDKVLDQIATETVGNSAIDLSAIYVLAQPSTPQPVVDDILDRARDGEKITRGEVKRLVDQTRRPDLPTMANPPAEPPEPATLANSAPDVPAEIPPPPPHDLIKERNRSLMMTVDQIERNLDMALFMLRDITPEQAIAVAARSKLCTMSERAKKAIKWWSYLDQLLNPTNLDAVADQLNNMVPKAFRPEKSNDKVSNSDRVLAILVHKPKGAYVGDIAADTGLPRLAADAALNALMKDGAVRCIGDGVYRLAPTRTPPQSASNASSP